VSVVHERNTSGRMTVTGKNLRIRRKSLSQCSSVHHKSHMRQRLGSQHGITLLQAYWCFFM